MIFILIPALVLRGIVVASQSLRLLNMNETRRILFLFGAA